VTTPKDRILAVLQENKRFLIVSHTNPDGDSIGSQLALASIIKDLGGHVNIFSADPVPANYHFLPGVEQIEVGKPSGRWDVLIALDSSDIGRIGIGLEEVKYDVLINIDHHICNQNFGDINWVEPDCAAVGEMIFEILEGLGLPLGIERAICIYTAIVTDSGCFQYMNTSARTHLLVARLLEEGIHPTEIAEKVFDTKSLQQMHLLGKALLTLQVGLEGKVAWFVITRDMCKDTGTTIDESEGFVDYVRALKGVEVALCFVEISETRTKVSMRSKGRVDVNKIASSFGGGGHRSAAGCIVKAPLEEAKRVMLELIKNGLCWSL